MIKASLHQLQHRLVELDALAEPLRLEERRAVIDFIGHAISVYRISASELYPEVSQPLSDPCRGSTRKRGAALVGRKIPPKYRDDQGNSWSGRGSPPRWIRDALATGRSLEDYRVDKT